MRYASSITPRAPSAPRSGTGTSASTFASNALTSGAGGRTATGGDTHGACGALAWSPAYAGAGDSPASIASCRLPESPPAPPRASAAAAPAAPFVPQPPGETPPPGSSYGAWSAELAAFFDDSLAVSQRSGGTNDGSGGTGGDGRGAGGGSSGLVEAAAAAAAPALAPAAGARASAADAYAGSQGSVASGNSRSSGGGACGICLLPLVEEAGEEVGDGDVAQDGCGGNGRVGSAPGSASAPSSSASAPLFAMPCCGAPVHLACVEACTQLRAIRKHCCVCQAGFFAGLPAAVAAAVRAHAERRRAAVGAVLSALARGSELLEAPATLLAPVSVPAAAAAATATAAAPSLAAGHGVVRGRVARMQAPPHLRGRSADGALPGR